MIPGSGRSPGEGRSYPLQYSWASLVVQIVKNLPAMQGTWVRSLGWEDPLEEGGIGYPLQYSGLGNAMDCIVRGVAQSRTRLSDFHCPEVRSPCHHHHPRVELVPSFQNNITHPLKQLSIPLPQPLAPTVPLCIDISAVVTSKHCTHKRNHMRFVLFEPVLALSVECLCSLMMV